MRKARGEDLRVHDREEAEENRILRRGGEEVTKKRDLAEEAEEYRDPGEDKQKTEIQTVKTEDLDLVVKASRGPRPGGKGKKKDRDSTKKK